MSITMPTEDTFQRSDWRAISGKTNHAYPL